MTELWWILGTPRTPLSLSIKLYRIAEIDGNAEGCGREDHFNRKSNRWRLSIFGILSEAVFMIIGSERIYLH